MYLTGNLCCFFWRHSFINSRAQLVSLMALRLTHVNPNAFRPCFMNFYLNFAQSKISPQQPGLGSSTWGQAQLLCQVASTSTGLKTQVL